MIGSLGEFMDIEPDQLFEAQSTGREESECSQGKVSKRRGISAFEQYVPDDKRELLVRY